MEIDTEKKIILEHKGSALVIANPGTGKTKLLAHKFVDLLKQGLNVEDVLCLTFTRKAKLEMEERIINLVQKSGIKVDLSKLNIFTFHSYAMENLEINDIVSSDLLRFSIFEYILEKEVFTYSEKYLLDDVVPKIENSIRYIKNYGILPKDIDIKKVKNNLKDLKKGKITKYSKEELEIYLEHFVKIFENYENNKTGLDYTDILITFLNIKDFEKYKFVLIDELQDVNNLEAKIALKSGEQFFSVGDKKQAIFGFQGGSTKNFEHFKKIGKEFKLTQNYRSTNQIIDYAKEYYISKNDSVKEELEGLKNAKGKQGKKPVIIEDEKFDKEKLVNLTKKLIQNLKEENGNQEQLGIIVRTNGQILKYTKILEQANIDFSATFSASSEEARENINRFVKAVFSNNVDVIKNAFFTPFFPCEMEKSFELSAKRKLNLEEIFEECPRFKEIRDKTKNIEDVNKLFSNFILPVCFAYGQEYVEAGIKLQNASREALNELKKISLEKFINYLKSVDILGGEITKKSKVVLTTIHKSKGLQYEKVIYLPSKTKNRSNFQDSVAEAILKTILPDYEVSELEEEDLRADFVAMTRAKNELYIITKKAIDYSNNKVEINNVDENVLLEEKLEEKQKLAFNLFVNKEYDKAKQLLESNKKWLEDYIKNYFKNLDKISFSTIQKNSYEFLKRTILHLNDLGTSISIGLTVHKKIEEYLKGVPQEITEKEKPFYENAIQIIQDLEKEGYTLLNAEYKIKMPIKKVIGIGEIEFTGCIDAIYKKDDEYLLLDWKTSRSESDKDKHRQQLALYKKAFSVLGGIHEEKIKTSIAYIGLRENINDGKIKKHYNNLQPKNTAIKTITKELNKIIEWKNNPELFIEELSKSQEEGMLIRAIKEELKK